MKVYCLNNISRVALNTLQVPDTTVTSMENADCVLVRSADMRETALPEHILAVARAGAGVNNIPCEEYAAQGVVVFNTPGANANAVKELVLAGLLLASRDILGGCRWVRENAAEENLLSAAEKAKKAFAGREIYGKKIAVVGLGAIGILVANACVGLGMRVVGFDPFLSTFNALKLDSKVSYVTSLAEAVADADFVTVHVPAMDSTRGMIGGGIIGKMKKGAAILNFSRESLVDEEALAAALEAGTIREYVTDFATPAAVAMKNAIVLPHLGASTEEAEDNCAVMAIAQLKDYLENGNIRNSVNYPGVDAGRAKGDGTRICVAHRNVPGMLANFTAAIAGVNGNIREITNKSRGCYAYTVIDVDHAVDAAAIALVDGVLRVRVI